MFFENYFQKRSKQAKNEIISNLSKNYLLKTVVGSKLFLETVFTDLKTSVRSTNHLRIFIQQGKAKELAQSKHNRKLKRFAFFFLFEDEEPKFSSRKEITDGNRRRSTTERHPKKCKFYYYRGDGKKIAGDDLNNY